MADLDISAPIDEQAVRAWRLDRVRRGLAEADMAGIVLVDPINLRYATGSRNMQVWTMHNMVRYAFVATQGPVVLFEIGAAQHLARGLETIDEIRPALSFDYMVVGERRHEMAGRMAAEIADLARASGGGGRRLVIDRADLLAVSAFEAQEIGRAGPQECRDRHRMPASA